MTTLLDSYMVGANLKDADFASLIGRDRTMVSKLRRGIITPTLELADRIERVTQGKVPMKSWVGGDHDATDTPAAQHASHGKGGEVSASQVAA